MEFTKPISLFVLMSAICVQCNQKEEQNKPRVLISTDIGGTDPDDFQSMIHLLMYADQFELEGLVSSPYGEGRMQDLLDMIDLYESDLSKLRAQAPNLPYPENLREICKQGALDFANFDGVSTPTEGSEWIIKCAEKPSEQPLWILVWGGIEDVAQALHDAPDIAGKVKIYWIGGPNKKWSVNAYAYIAQNHPEVWMIEANATYRGWFMEDSPSEDIGSKTFYGNYIAEKGAMGANFKNHYNGEIKMGDTPSLAYLMSGDPNDPLGESWGGSFTSINRGSRTIFEGNSSARDTVAAYAVLEWRFEGPQLEIPRDSAVFTFEISKQVWPGYYLGDGIYGIRYSSKKPEVGTYVSESAIPELDGLTGQYVSTTPWPGKASDEDYLLGSNWYSDRLAPSLFIENQQGAKTVSKHRRAFLMDWAKRWEWLKQ